MEKEFRFFLNKDFSKYAGSWIAICEERIVSSNKSINKAIKTAKEKCGGKKFLFAKIPKGNQALIL